MAYTQFLERAMLDQVWGGGSSGTLNGALTAGQTAVVSIVTNALTAAIPANATIIVSPGTVRAEAFTVTAAGAALNATAIPVVSQTSRNIHSIGDHVQVVGGQTVDPAGMPVLAPVLYLALSTGLYTAAVVEPSGNAYARVAVPNNPVNFPASTGNAPASKNNGTTITFPTATGAAASWGTIQSYAWYDDPTAGNLLFQAPISPTQVIGGGDTASFASSTLPVTLN